MKNRSLQRLLIIIRREYLVRVKKKSFILTTLLLPLISVAMIAGTALLSSINSESVKTVLVVDKTGDYFGALQNTNEYVFEKTDKNVDEIRNAPDGAYATLVISDNLLEHPEALTLYSDKQVAPNLEQTVAIQLNEYVREKKLASYDIPDLQKIIHEIQTPVNLQTKIWSKSSDEERTSSSNFAMTIGYIFTLLMYMFILMYGSIVMQTVMEEKTNRIVEVIVSSVKPSELMMGKLIGVGMVALTQLAIWIALMAAIIGLVPGIEPLQDVKNMLASVNIGGLCLYFILFYIGGYLIYGALFTAVGAIVNAPEDANQYMTPITFLIIFAFMAGAFSLENPDGPLAFWTSMIPFTSPIVMMIRAPFGIPFWQIALSLAILLLTVIVIVKIVGKIYRIGILMYGKKPTYSELMKWLRY
jgi:ABC-2 type transport system permease protein